MSHNYRYIQKKKIASKKNNLERKCVLQESCKTVRHWRRSILHVKGEHCVGDWFTITCRKERTLMTLYPDNVNLGRTGRLFGG